MLIAQITDMHVVKNGELWNGITPTNEMLKRAVSRINNHSPKVDAIIATGDLTDHGLVTEYEALAEILAEAEAPMYLIPGNHDHPETLRQVFSDHTYLPKNGFLAYIVEDLPVTLIGLDTTVQGLPRGELCGERIEWLSNVLEKTKKQPVIIFMHHPPFRTGIWWMDAIGLKGRKKIEEVIKNYDNVEAVLAGHIHRQIQKSWAGTLGYIAPSTAYQLALDLDGKDFLGCTNEPPAFSLHQWKPNIGLISHVCYVEKAQSFVPPDHANPETMQKVRAYFEKAEIEMEKEIF